VGRHRNRHCQHTQADHGMDQFHRSSLSLLRREF
jgi:hypothetical protein